MNDGQVRNLRKTLEHQHFTTHTGGRLSLPDMRKKERLKKRTLQIAASMVLFFSEITVASLAGYIVSLWAIPAAYRQRGYDAIGGEWLLILTVAVTAYTIYHKWLFKKLEEQEEKEDLS